jgi:phosphate transport system substrate-binding protein
MKKYLSALLAGALLLTALAGCGTAVSSSTPASSAPASSSAPSFNNAKEITVVSREEGSGTRGAFVELFGIEQKNSEGKKSTIPPRKPASPTATSVMMTAVAGDTYAIGYISLGSLNNTVKALKIDGAEATVANIKSGTYKIAGPSTSPSRKASATPPRISSALS